MGNTLGLGMGVLPQSMAPTRSIYGFGSPFGRGHLDYNAPTYGSFSRRFGPMGGPAYAGQGMGSLPSFVDPRGFGMDWNRIKPMDLGQGNGILPGFGKPMFPNSPFPSSLVGLNGANHFGAPPFTGKPVRAMGPYGPFVIEDGYMDSNPYKMNTTLMGPLPFGPYGGSPYMPFSGGMMPTQGGGGGMGGMIPNQGGGPGGGGKAMMGHGGMAGGMGGQGGGGYPMVGSMPGAMIPGLHPTHNPYTALHRASMFPMGGQGMGPPPGLVNGFGSGYPHPDWDRYHSVAIHPPGPFGGGVIAPAAR